MSNKLLKEKDKVITMTAGEYLLMKEKMKQEIKLEIYEEIVNKTTSMQAQALMLSFGMAMYKVKDFTEPEIGEVLAYADDIMANFWSLADLEKFREYVRETCGFDVRIPGYADETIKSKKGK